MQSQPVELIAIFGDDVSVAKAAWCSTNKDVTLERYARVPALIKMLATEKHCYDAETEVFTFSGWKLWSDVTKLDWLAAVNEDGSFQFEKPTTLIAERYQGKMYGASSQHVNFLVTTNHRMWVSRRTNNGYKPNEIVLAEDLVGKCYRLTTSAYDIEGDGGSYQEGWLYGFFLGDGYRSDNAIHFHLRKKRKIDALCLCLNELSLPYKRYYNEDGTQNISVMCDDPIFYGKAKQKHISEHVFNMSHDHKTGVLQGLFDSDAHNKRDCGAYVFTSFSAQLTKDVDRLCTLLGKFSKLTLNADGDAHKVVVLTRSTSPLVNPAQHTEKSDFMVDYDGMIYCAAVSTGLLLTRRNRCTMVSGNTVPFEHNYMCFLITSDIATHIHFLKHRIGFSISSQSARYSEFKEDLFYTPEDWPEDIQAHHKSITDDNFKIYHAVIDALVASGASRKRAKESARFALPYATQIKYMVSCNLLSFIHFQKLRNSEHAQVEIRLIAAEMLRLVKESGNFDLSLEAWGL